MKKIMDEQQKEKLKRIYKVYDVVDWIIALVIIGAPVLFIIFNALNQGISLSDIGDEFAIGAFEAFVYHLSNIPTIAIIPLFIVYTAYTVFCFILYIKVWPIKEIRNTFTYWFDWILTIFLTTYEIFIIYAILFA